MLRSPKELPLTTIDDNALVEEASRLLPTVMRLLKSTMVGSCGDITNVPYGQLGALAHLYQNGKSTVSEVAGGLGVSLATASELVDRQVETGWIERNHNPADRRKVLLNLSDEATQIFAEIHEQRRQQLAAALDKLEPSDRPAFV